MKIAVFDNLPEGGAKRVVLEQIRYLHQSQHQVIHYTNSVDTHFSTRQVADTVIPHTIQLSQFHGLLRPLTELSYIKLAMQSYVLARKIDAQKCSVCIVHPCMFTQAPLLLLFLNTPTLYFIEEPLRLMSERKIFKTHAHGFKMVYEYLRRKGIALLDKKACRHATLRVANSQFTQKNVQHYYSAFCSVLKLGVNTQIFFPPLKTTTRNYFLWIGARDEIHGYSLLTAALGLLKKIPEIMYVEFQKAKLPLTDKQLCSLYQGAYATLCLSHNEPFGLTSVESQACGTPVIAVAEGGYKETVVDGITGTLISRSVNELARALELYMENLSRTNQQGAAGVQEVKQNWTWQKHGIALEKMINGMTI
ncbi:glycosyltransferase family 4 protein [Candidatus Woesebacteria bacterium]|nr:glycosyltransferase family 4 protein [Candidatus Woesebacteria bacterium]